MKLQAKRGAVWVGAAFSLLLAAGCAGASHDTALPIAQAGGPSHRTTRARLVIHVPPRKRDKKIRVHGHYVSPATASLTWSVTPALGTGVSSGEVDISASNPNCTVTGVIGYLACTVDIPGIAPATPYTFSFTTWDALGGTGNVLSANDDVAFTATPGGNNLLSATLGGVATSLAISPITPYRITSSGSKLTVYGNHPVKFSVTPVDAKDNFIIGPGAPQPSVGLADGANATLSAVGSSSPNEYILTSTYEPTDPAVPSTATLNVAATPVPGSGSSTLSEAIPVSLYQPWIYVTDYRASAVAAFDEDGNMKIASGSAFSGLGQPSAITYDPDNGWLYVGDGSAPKVGAFDRLGSPKIAPFPVTAVLPLGLAYDTHNHWLYVASNNPTGTTGAYDAQGNPQSTPGGFPLMQFGPRQMSFDPLNNHLYAALDNQGTVLVYDETGAAVTTSGGFPNVPHTEYTNCAGYDPIHDWIWTCDISDIAVYDADGNSVIPATNIGFSVELLSATFDPYNGIVYFGNQQPGGGGLVAFDQQLNPYPLAGPAESLSLPSSIVVVK